VRPPARGRVRLAEPRGQAGAARGSPLRRCRSVRRGVEGGSDRRRRRGRRRARRRARARRERTRRDRPRRAPARPRGPGGPRVTQPRHTEPVPLGGAGSPPYSKGLMARALMAVGVRAVPAYELARRIDEDIDARAADGIDLDRLALLAVNVLGEVEGIEEGAPPAKFTRS